jgi:hypothetical protein
MVNKYAPADSLPADYTRYGFVFGQSLHSLDESFNSSAMCMGRRSIPARPRIRVTSGEKQPCRERLSSAFDALDRSSARDVSAKEPAICNATERR